MSSARENRCSLQGGFACRIATLLPVLFLAAGCGGASGLGFPAGFIWGAATSAHQIEGGNTNNNWYQFETLERFAGKTAEPSGDAVRSYELFERDAEASRSLELGSYRFSVEWSRLEPRQGEWDEREFEHYDAVIAANIERGLRPMITLHHFTDPIWVFDLRRLDECLGQDPPIGPDNLCGWANPQVVDRFEQFAARAAARWGDRVDHWITINEPMAVITAGWIYGVFPPGQFGADWNERVLPVLRNMIAAHAAAYRAIKENDGQDADGDGTASVVGFSQSVAYYLPADGMYPAHVAAAELAEYFMNYLFVDSLVQGGLDTDLDGSADEQHPQWRDTLDLLGLQYYYRAFTVPLDLYPALPYAPCLKAMDDVLPGLYESIGCPAPDENALTLMGWEHYPEGLYRVVKRFSARYPGLPLVITENGISTRSDRRRSQSLVRHLVWLHRAIEEGADVRGYYHWSLMDNFEWAEGFSQPFGLYAVDRSTFERIPKDTVDVYRRICSSNSIPQDIESEFTPGPLSSEPGS